MLLRPGVNRNRSSSRVSYTRHYFGHLFSACFALEKFWLNNMSMLSWSVDSLSTLVAESKLVLPDNRSEGRQSWMPFLESDPRDEDSTKIGLSPSKTIGSKLGHRSSIAQHQIADSEIRSNLIISLNTLSLVRNRAEFIS